MGLGDKAWAGSACSGWLLDGSTPLAVSGSFYHAVMPTQLSLEQHLEALVRSGAALGEAAATAGLDTRSPPAPPGTSLTS